MQGTVHARVTYPCKCPQTEQVCSSKYPCLQPLRLAINRCSISKPYCTSGGLFYNGRSCSSQQRCIENTCKPCLGVMRSSNLGYSARNLNLELRILLVLSREYGHIVYRGCIGIIFPYSLLRTTRKSETSPFQTKALLARIAELNLGGESLQCILPKPKPEKDKAITQEQ